MKRSTRPCFSNAPRAPWGAPAIAALALAMFVATTCAFAAPPTLPVPPAPSEQVQLSASLAKLLRELDRDQTRRLSSAAKGNAPHLFHKLAARELEDRIGCVSDDASVFVVVGVRGPRPNSAFEVQHAIRVEAVPGRAGGRQVLLRLPSARQAYERPGTLDPAATAEIAGLFAASSEQRIPPSEALALMSQKRRAAFIVAFPSPVAGASPSIASLVVLPDSIRIDIAGDQIGLPEPEPGSTPPGSSTLSPRPSAALPSDTAPDAEDESLDPSPPTDPDIDEPPEP